MKPLPEICPNDLRERIETVLGFRSYGPSELYGVVREWIAEQEAKEPSEPPSKAP